MTHSDWFKFVEKTLRAETKAAEALWPVEFL